MKKKKKWIIGLCFFAAICLILGLYFFGPTMLSVTYSDTENITIKSIVIEKHYAYGTSSHEDITLPEDKIDIYSQSLEGFWFINQMFSSQGDTPTYYVSVIKYSNGSRMSVSCHMVNGNFKSGFVKPLNNVCSSVPEKYWNEAKS
ncbi:MAG: hypothetical protein WC196_00855 [Bacilli bacterium]